MGEAGDTLNYTQAKTSWLCYWTFSGVFEECYDPVNQIVLGKGITR